MKKASFVVMGLGLAIIIFSVVCFIVAGDLIDTADELLYSGYWLQMGDPASTDIDHVALMKINLQDVSAFAEFAYYYRVWLLAGGGVVLAAGIVMLVIGIQTGKKSRSAGPMPSGHGMICPSCGASVAANSAFCMNCGASLAVKPASIKPVSIDSTPAGTFCTGCGAYVEAGSKFCMSCGTPVPGTAVSGTPASGAAAAAAVSTPVSGGASYVGSSTGTISATVLKGDAGTIRLDTSGTSSGTMRLDTRAVAEPEPFVKPVEEERPASSGTVMINVKSKPAEEKPAPAKGRLSRAGDL